MSYPDPTPPNQFTPFTGSGDDGFWPPCMMENQLNEQPDFASAHFEPHQAFQWQNISENQPNFPQFQPTNLRINPTNVPGSRGTSHLFYKTRICLKFMEGTCQNGDECAFAHGHDDLREPPPNWQELVRQKDKGTGGGGWSDEDQWIHRMMICRRFYNGEECPYGEKCHFLHERATVRPMKKFKADMPGGRRESDAISICVTGDAGGSGAEFDQATYRKTKMCSKWEMGQCPFGERCHFAHGLSVSELRGTSNPDEAQVAVNDGFIQRKPFSVTAPSNIAPINLVIGAPPKRDEEQTNASRWKSKKKINRIYGDWLDGLSPPRGSPRDDQT